MYPAQANFDYDPLEMGRARFEPDQKEIILHIMLRTSFVLQNFNFQFGGSMSISSAQNDSFVRSLYPKMFQVVLVGCTNSNCDIDVAYSIANVTLINDDYALWRMYGQTLHDEDEASLEELNEISVDLTRNLSSTEIDLISKTLSNILLKQHRLVSNELALKNNQTLIDSRRETMFTTMCNFMSSKRRDMTGNVHFFHLLENLLYLDVSTLNTMSQYLEKSAIVYKKYTCIYSSFNYVCARVNSSSLDEVWFQGEFYQLNFSTKFELNKKNQARCRKRLEAEFTRE